VLGYGAVVTCGGIGLGIACSLFLTGAMKILVYRIRTQDPITLSAVALLFLACGLIASYIPARRAMRVDVIEALKE
jgi:ABC-type antimicrobial peptide transport system permease subunit